MSKENRKKYIFSKEEKKIMREMEQELTLMGIPRQDWALYIQRVLKDHVREKKKRSKRKKSNLSKLLYRIKNTFSSKLQNLLFRKLKAKNNQFEGMPDMFGDQIIDKDQRLVNSIFSGININKKDFGDHGTFILDRNDKKSYIVDFEDNND